MRRRLFPMVILAGLVVLAMLPAEAAGVTPTFVGGNSDCDSVNSSASFSVTIVEPVGSSTHSLPGAPGATLQLSNVRRRAFDFTTTGATIHDVIVKGSGSNWYHYDPSVGSDTDLVIPNGNKLNLVHFCYEAVPTFSISGTKFNDADASGTVGVGESGLGGWDIEAYQGDALQASATTGSNGTYVLALEAGTYQICEVAQEGWVQTSPGGCHDVTVGPNATGVDFLNSEGTAIECGVVTEASNEDGSVTGAFTRVGEDCESVKLVDLEVTEANEIVFIPRGAGTASYTGVLTFEKSADDPSALILQYDPDDDGVAPYKDVPDCTGTTENPTLPAGDTWCVVSAGADYLGESLWKMTWNVYGEGDPRFK